MCEVSVHVVMLTEVNIHTNLKLYELVILPFVSWLTKSAMRGESILLEKLFELVKRNIVLANNVKTFIGVGGELSLVPFN